MREYDNDFRPYFFNNASGNYYDDESDYYNEKYEEVSDEVIPAPRKQRGIAFIIFVCIIVSTIFGASGAFVYTQYLLKTNPYIISRPPVYAPPNVDLAEVTGSQLSVQEIIDLTADSVVEIRTERVVNDMWMMQYVTQGAGSGVIISDDGFIMTNNHVINNSSKISVTLKNGQRYDAILIGTDNRTDVAVIKITAKNLTPVTFGDSNSVAMGDLAVAIGNPLGQLGGTATVGIISALDRQLIIEGRSMTLLQTDASINPGNSGGGLFNQYGELIGLVVAKTAGSNVEGLGFAIPINTAQSIAMNLKENGYVKGRPQIGIVMRDMTSLSLQDAIYYGVRTPGVYIDSVESENAKQAGFQAGDMLYAIEDVLIEKTTDLTDALQKYSVGDTVKITVIRGEETLELSVVLGEQRPS